MATTYEPIATNTLGSAAASVTFSSIPATYTDLVLVINASSTTTNNHYVRVGNGSIDTGSNYSSTILYGDGSSAGSSRLSNNTDGMYVGQGSTSMFTNTLHFQNYSNTTTFKTGVFRAGVVTSGGWVSAAAGLWRSTSAINIIEYRTAAGNINSGSTFTLYGIKAA
jgi:hypothetical protein